MKGADGKSIIAGRKEFLEKFTEEKFVGASGSMPFLLETRLRELGGDFHSARFSRICHKRWQFNNRAKPCFSEKTAKLTIEAIEVAKSA